MNFHRKTFSSVLLLALVGGLLCLASNSEAQSASFINSTVTKKLHDGPSLGRDLWFTICENYDAGGGTGKVDVLYVSAQTATTVTITCDSSASQTFTLQADSVLAFKIPIAWKIVTSGVIQNKAIRVYSPDADLAVNLMSFNPYTTEGIYVIPTIGWGKNYVVAAYPGLFESTFDFASEYSVTSNQANTNLVTTPACDIRDASASTVLHSKLVPFNDTYQRGDICQYKCVVAQNCEDYDVTGTVITANHPVGVVGASMCPNIPCDYPYCDFVCEMNQPQRLWSNQYLTIPFSGRKTTTNKGDTFLVIGSEDQQTIYIQDPISGDSLIFDPGLPKFSPSWFNQIINPTKFFSDKPFELVQYENSSTFPDPNNSVGDGSMTTVPGIQQFAKKIFFQIPTAAGLPYTFYNYVNILIPSGYESQTYLDGKSLSSVPNSTKVAFYDRTWTGYVVAGLTPGTHVVTCGMVNNVQGLVGAYVFGYGQYDSYTWPAQLGTSTFASTDTLPLTASITGSCYCTHVGIADHTGLADSKIAEIISDSITNMSISFDPNYVAGTEMDNSFYDVCVLDSTSPAFCSVSAFDYAGNRTTVTSSYTPRVLAFDKPILNFQTTVFTATVLDTVWLKNSTPTTFYISGIGLKDTTLGFAIVSHSSDTIPSGDSERVIVKFNPQAIGTSIDYVTATGACWTLSAELTGMYIAPQMSATDLNFGEVTIGKKNCGVVTITNTGNAPLILTTTWLLQDTARFSFPDKTLLPDTLDAGKSITLTLCYTPTDTSGDSSRMEWGTNLEPPTLQSKKYSLLIGKGIVGLSVEKSASPEDHLTIRPNPSKEDWVELEGSILGAGATVSLIDVLGREVRSVEWKSGRTGTLSLEGLSAGTYSIRARSNDGKVQSEKLTIVK